MHTLTIDDKLLSVNAMQRLLRSIDPTGTHAGALSAAEAIEYLSEQSVDVIFLDIELPDMSGIDLARRIEREFHTDNIIFVTGYPDYALAAHGVYVSGFLTKPVDEMQLREALRHLRHPGAALSERPLTVQCFGNFEVFAGGEPLHFQRSKTKELFAYLVDRRGASCTAGELLAVLWEDRPDTDSQRTQLRNLIADLRRTLREVGAEEALIRSKNTVAIRKSCLSCDYYDYLAGVPGAAALYQGEYMTQYSWAEMTTAALR